MSASPASKSAAADPISCARSCRAPIDRTIAKLMHDQARMTPYGNTIDQPRGPPEAGRPVSAVDVGAPPGGLFSVWGTRTPLLAGCDHLVSSSVGMKDDDRRTAPRHMACFPAHL